MQLNKKSEQNQSVLLIIGGEPTVSVEGSGIGGRNQHAAMLMLWELMMDQFDWSNKIGPLTKEGKEKHFDWSNNFGPLTEDEKEKHDFNWRNKVDAVNDEKKHFDWMKKHQVTLVSAGTDGQDGPTDVAGAVVDSELAQFVCQNLDVDIQKYITNCDSYNLFREIDKQLSKTDQNSALSHVKPGLTGTNVMDLIFISFVL